MWGQPGTLAQGPASFGAAVNPLSHTKPLKNGGLPQFWHIGSRARIKIAVSKVLCSAPVAVNVGQQCCTSQNSAGAGAGDSTRAQCRYSFWAVKLLICVNSFPRAHEFTRLNVSAAGGNCPALRFLRLPTAGGALFVEGK